MSFHRHLALTLLTVIKVHPAMAESCPDAGRSCMAMTPLDDSATFIHQALDSAQRSVVVSTYSLTEPGVVERLIDTAQRGVTVEVLLDFDNSYDTESLFNRLAVAKHPGITLYRATHLRGGSPQSHNKFMLIDDRQVIMGSANLSGFGFFGAFDYFLKFDSDTIVQGFRAEHAELKRHAQIVCEELSRNPTLCGTGQEFYAKPYFKLLRTGILGPDMVRTELPECAPLLNELGSELLNRYNQIRYLSQTCLKDARLLRTLERLAASEYFSDGERVQDYCARIPATPETASSTCQGYGRVLPREPGQDRVYFSPEDNPEDQIAQELRLLESNGEDYLVLSLTLITNRFLINELVKVLDKNVPVFLLLDENSSLSPESNQVHTTRLISRIAEKNRVYRLKNPYGSRDVISLHHRMALLHVKGQDLLILGSANWSRAGFQYSDESLIFNQNPGLIPVAQDHLLNLMEWAGADLQLEGPLKKLVDARESKIMRPRTNLVVVNNVPEELSIQNEISLWSGMEPLPGRVSKLRSRQWTFTVTETDPLVYLRLTNLNNPALTSEYVIPFDQGGPRFKVSRYEFSELRTKE
jgi:phosphatidylserine/phosphatidylglycerophosphate/cardiolipin synthase-like enzyme